MLKSNLALNYNRKKGHNFFQLFQFIILFENFFRWFKKLIEFIKMVMIFFFCALKIPARSHLFLNSNFIFARLAAGIRPAIPSLIVVFQLLFVVSIRSSSQRIAFSNFEDLRSFKICWSMEDICTKFKLQRWTTGKRFQPICPYFILTYTSR
jgi:hypothetical protein